MDAITKIKDTANYSFSTRNFAPDIALAASEQFPVSEITGHIGIQDPDDISFSDITSNRVQSLNSVHTILASSAFTGLQDVDSKRGALSLDFDMPKKMSMDGLKMTSSNGEHYFCANLKVIRAAVEQMRHTICGEVGDFAKAVQKSLVSQALKTNKPVMFVDSLLEEDDKMIIYKCDRFLHKKAKYDAGIEANALAPREQSL